MKVIGICGSPRKGGNTDILLDKALEGARSAGCKTEKLSLNDLDFKPCQECRECEMAGMCAVDDDMGIVYKKLEEADAVIVASPIFFGSVSAQLKMMIDRFNYLWVRKYILKYLTPTKRRRKGIFISVSGTDKSTFFNNAREIIKIFYAVLDIDYSEELFYGGVEKKAAIKDKKGALDEAFRLGASLVT